MSKVDAYIAFGGFAVSAVIFGWLCLTAFDKPVSAVVMLGIASFIVGYINGRW